LKEKKETGRGGGKPGEGKTLGKRTSGMKLRIKKGVEEGRGPGLTIESPMQRSRPRQSRNYGLGQGT